MDNKIENTMETEMKQHINEYHYNLVPSHDNKNGYSHIKLSLFPMNILLYHRHIFTVHVMSTNNMAFKG